MKILVLNFILIILYGIIIQNLSCSEDKKRKIFLTLSFIQLVIVHTFVDYNTLPDLPYYSDAYSGLQSMQWGDLKGCVYNASLELGFLYYMKGVSLVFPDFTGFLLVNSIIVFCFYFGAIKRYSGYEVISVLLILVTTYNQSLFVLRQHLAMAIVLYSWRYIIDKKILKFLIVVLPLFFIHKSVLIYPILYFLCQIKGTKNYIIYTILFAIVGGMIYSYMLNWIGAEVLGYYTYVTNARYEGANFVNVLIYGAMLFSYLFFCKGKCFEEGRNKIVLSCSIIAFLGAIFGLGNSATGRLFMYFNMVSFLVIPIINENIREKSFMYLFDIVVISLFSYITFLGSSVQYFEPLKYLFEN